jgi:hypothetical protein
VVIAWAPPTFLALSLAVAALMVLSLLVTATGTARFAVAMGSDANIGYAVGGVFDLARAFLLAAVIALWFWRSFGFAAIFGIAWLGSVTISWLATHATVSAAVSGRWRSAALPRPSWLDSSNRSPL